MLVSASNGAAQFCIFEQWVAPGTGAPTHSHPVEEVLTVREGEAEMWMDQQRLIVYGRPVADRAGRAQARLSQFRNDDAAPPCGAGLADLRSDLEGATEPVRRWD